MGIADIKKEASSAGEALRMSDRNVALSGRWGSEKQTLCLDLFYFTVLLLFLLFIIINPFGFYVVELGCDVKLGFYRVFSGELYNVFASETDKSRVDGLCQAARAPSAEPPTDIRPLRPQHSDHLLIPSLLGLQSIFPSN